MTVNVNDPTASGMILTFDDEFNSNSTSSDNAASGTLWSNHLWYDNPDPAAISVSGGVLNLASGGELSSVDSAGQGFGQKYGYFEIDMKVPAGIGTWPAFWLMSQQHAQNGANPASELDIIEGQGNRNNGYYTTLHSNTGSGADQVNPMPNFTGNVSTTPLDAGYHRFGALWDPNSNLITYYFDGKAVGTSTEYSTTNSSPMMILIDNWLGDIGWGGNSPTAGQNYGALQIDYVRVYQFAGEGGTAIAPQAVSAATGQTDPTALANADGVGLTSGGTSGAGGPTSANGTVVAGTNGDIVTAAGNTFAIDAAGQITENGAVMAITNSVTELAYVNSTLYQEATSQNLWWSFTEATNTWTQTSDPIPGSGSTSGSGGSTPPVMTVIEAKGATTLATSANHFYLLDSTGAGPSLKYAGADFVAGELGNWAPIGAEKTATGYEIAWKATGANQYSLWSTDSNGNYISNVVGTVAGVVSGSNAGLEASETLFQQDLNGDGIIGVPPVGMTVIEAKGATTLATSANHFYLLDSTGAGPSLKYAGADFVSGELGNWAPIGAEKTGTGYEIAWKATGANQYSLWSTDSNGNYISNVVGTVAGVVSGSNAGLEASETLFQQDLNGDGIIGIPPVGMAVIGSSSTSGSGGSTIGPTPSPNETVVVGTNGDIVTAAGNTFAINASGQITENGTTIAITNSVTELAYVSGTLYQEATTQNLWWSFNEATNTWTQTSDPLPLATTSSGGSGAAASAVAPTLAVADPSGNVGTAIPLTITAAQASSSLAAANLTVTVSNLAGATLNHGTETAGVYTLHASDLSGLTVTPAPSFSGTLALHVTATDTEASSSTNASSAMQTLDVSVTAPTASVNDTVATGTGGDIVTAAGNTFAIDAAGQITENGSVMAITNSVTELAYVNSTLYQEATSQNLWWSYSETSNAWTATSNPLTTLSTPPVNAMAPMLAVNPATGNENSAIPLSIQAEQASSALSTSDLSVTVSNLEGATLNHGTEVNGVYTLKSSDLTGLTVMPAANFTGTLPLHVMATDTEAGSSASSAAATLNVSVSTPATTEALMAPSVIEGSQSIYILPSLTTANEHIASFNLATDLLDVAPLLHLLGYKGLNPIADHVLNLEPTTTGGTAVMVDPSGVSPTHGTTVVTLDHVLPQSMPAADIIWH